MSRANVGTIVAFMMIVGLSVSLANADTVQLVNGDTISGKVISLDFNQVKLETDLLGNLVIARDRVAAIAFGDRPVAVVTAPGKTAPATARPPSAGSSIAGLGMPGGVDAAVKQLQTQGIDPNVLSTIEKKFPLLANTEAQDYFNNTVGGLLSGKIGVQDIRKDAVKARDQLEEFRDDIREQLGPGVDTMFNAYLGILNKFIRETGPPEKGGNGK